MRTADPLSAGRTRGSNHGRPRGVGQAFGRILLATFRAPFAPRSRRELLYCLIGVPIGAGEVTIVAALLGADTAVSTVRAVLIVAVAAALLVATGAARGIGAGFRRLAAWLPGTAVAPPPAVAGNSLVRRARARLRDASGWKALAYLALHLPMAALELYALLYWVGLANLTYVLWWRLFRNHPPGVSLRPVAFLTPFGAFRIGTFPGTLGVFAAGAALVLAAPWVTRGVVSLDGWLVRRLLGPGRLAERVQQLEQARAHVVEDAADRLRRIERDLHDGAQVQLATLAMALGQAKEKLERDSVVPYDPAGARELIAVAHRHAKEVMAELRDLARGIHPPALDLGLDAALRTLVARSAVPATLRIDLAARPAPSIETIAYFSVAELLANVAKHGQAQRATVEVTAPNRTLTVRVSDDGVGGARLGAGGGLAGLANRAAAVDGSLRVSSPAGGPTVVTVELPLLV